MKIYPDCFLIPRESLFIVPLLIYGILSGSLWADTDETLWMRLENEAPQGWSHLKQADGNVHAIFATSVEVLDNRDESKQPKPKKTEIKINNENVFLRKVSETRDKVTCKQGEFAYQIFRESSDKPWQILYQGRANDEIEEYLFLSGVGWLSLPYTIQTIEIPEFIHDPGFSLVSLSEKERENGSSLVRLEFQFDSKIANQKIKDLPINIKSGVLIFDPELYWAIVVSELTLENAKSIQRIEYDKDLNGNLVVRGVTDEQSNLKGDTAIYNRKYSTYQHVSVPEADFSIEAFGLPALSDSGISKFPVGRLLLIIAILAFTLSFLMYRVHQKKASA